jgi:uncharacterized protein
VAGALMSDALQGWLDAMQVSPPQFAVCAGAILLATVVQRVTGQAFGMICSPLIALSAPQHVPVLIFLCGLPAMLHSLRADFSGVRWHELKFALAGRVFGASAAGGVLAMLTNPRVVGLVIGGCVLAGVALSFTRLRIALGGASLTCAGAISGFMATLTSIGAPPIALLYQHQPVDQSRATLNAYFLLGSGISLTVLGVYGLIRLPSVLLFCALAPVMGLGVLAGDVALRRLRLKSLRPFTLTLATAAACLLIARSMA